MASFTYIMKICYQVLVTVVMCYGAYTCYNRQTGLMARAGNRSFTLRKRESISFLWMMLFCLCEGVYTYICGEKGQYIFDRAFYAKRFSLGIYTQSSSIGLYYLQDILSGFTRNPDVLFFVTGALYALITVIAYNNYEEKESQVWVLLCASQYLLYGCYQLKQALASALIGLSIAFVSKNRKIWSVVFLIIALLFHEAAWVMVPVYIIIFNSKTKWIRNIGYIFLALMVFGFQSFSTIVIRYASTLIPGLSNQLGLYVTDSGNLVTENNMMTIFKGIPYYIITIEGFLYRNDLKERISEYDAFLLLSAFVSVTTFLSAFMYWMWRFGELVYLPTFIFAARIYKEKDDSNSKLLFWLIVVLLAIFTYRKLFISYFSYGGLV